MSNAENDTYASINGTKIVKLTSSNYREWSFDIKSVLLNIQGELHLRVEVPVPTDEELLGSDASSRKITEDYHAASRVLSLLLLSLSPEQKQLIINSSEPINTAKKCWNFFKRLYENTDIVDIVGLLRQICRSNLQDFENMAAYVAAIRGAYGRLIAGGKKISDRFIYGTLLLGLPEDYDPFIATITGQNIEIKVDYVVEKLLTEYKRKNMNDDPNAPKALRIGTKFKKRSEISKYTGPPCTVSGCRKPTSHSSERCYLKIGNPWDRAKSAIEPVDAKVATTSHSSGWMATAATDGGENSRFDFINSKLSTARVTHLKNENSGVTQYASALKVNHLDSTWYIDSGASENFCKSASAFEKNSLKQVNPIAIDTAQKNSRIYSSHIGTVSLSLGGSSVPNAKLDIEARLVPELDANLLSVRQLTNAGYQVSFFGNGGTIEKDDITYGECYLENNLYRLKTVENTTKVGKAYYSKTKPVSLDTWHKRLCHMGHDSITKMAKYDLVKGIKLLNQEQTFCDGCALGKSTTLPYPKLSGSKTTKMLELVHVDLWTSPVNSLGGAKYALIIIDDYTDWCCVFPLKKKNDAFDSFVEYKNQFENMHSSRIQEVSVINPKDHYTVKRFRSDNGGEFKSKKFKNFLINSGIVHETSAPYAHPQNGRVERKIRTLVNATRAQMANANCPKSVLGRMLALYKLYHEPNKPQEA